MGRTAHFNLTCCKESIYRGWMFWKNSKKTMQIITAKQWKGPVIVIGQDGAVIFVRHLGIYVCVHHFRLWKTDDNHSVHQETGTKTQRIILSHSKQLIWKNQQWLKEVRKHVLRLKAGQTITYTVHLFSTRSRVQRKPVEVEQMCCMACWMPICTGTTKCS